MRTRPGQVSGPRSLSSSHCKSTLYTYFVKTLIHFGRFFLEGTAATYAFSSDLPASISIAWSLWAIFSHQTTSVFVHWSALAFSILALAWVVKGAYDLYTRGGGRIVLDEEQGPLITS